MLGGCSKGSTTSTGRRSHAYGSAANVPDLLRALLDPSTTPDAYSELFTNIWHQGTVYEATSYAVPFIMEVALDRDAPDRVEALGLLRYTATGSSQVKIRRQSPVRGPESPQEKAQLDLKELVESAWIAAAGEAVTRSRRALLAMVRGGESGVLRSAASVVLAALSSHADELVVSRREALDDRSIEPIVAASACVALAELARFAGQKSTVGLDRELAALAEDNGSPLVRSLATVAFCLVAASLFVLVQMATTNALRFSRGPVEWQPATRRELAVAWLAWAPAVALFAVTAIVL